MATEYTEPQKVAAREEMIDHSIRALTVGRTDATLCRRTYVREVRDALVERGGYDGAAAAQLTDETIARWEAFYDSIAQTREANNLKVAYLCGPNPENDLRVFCAAGILPENIWAFESDAQVHSKAISAALASEFPFIKIINGGIDTFLEASPMRFDIVYLDFCGPLPNRNKKQKTLLAISRVLYRHALNSPGALITNVSLPTAAGDPEGRALLAKLVACYLYPKNFLEGDDGAIAQGYEFDDWLAIVSSQLDEYYGQFVTRLLMDNASFISPYNRFPQNTPIFRKFFKSLPKGDSDTLLEKVFHFTDDEFGGGDIIIDAGEYPVLWSFAALDRKLNAKDENYPQWVNLDANFAAFAETFLTQLRTDGNKDDLIRNTCELTFSMLGGDEANAFLADPIVNIVKTHRFQDYFQFCDLVLGHQIVELLFRQVAVPYHVNVEATRRWRYQAKETPMFMDMTILDECRYLYDWMPTTEMVSAGFSDVERQLSYRFALDGVCKHRRWYNSEFFSGTGVIDQFTKPFDAKMLRPRTQL
jgi:hypothetical protein